MAFLLPVFLVLLGLLKHSLAHYTFGILAVNGSKSADFQYVREVTPTADLDPRFDPNNTDSFARIYPHRGADLRSTNFTCGRKAWESAPSTETAVVLAGSELSFYVSPQAPDSPLYTSPWNGKMFHEGPAEIYMAKAKDDVELENWKGDDGKWFKIYELLADQKSWLNFQKTSINFTIPASTPPGKYLLRVEQFTWWPDTQFYLACAHIDVRGPGGGVPTDFVSFPGAYYAEDVEKHWQSLNHSGDNSNYINIGAKVWEG